jgi:hypothetical protein
MGAQVSGWAMVDALLALVFWSTTGLALMAQTQHLMAQQRSAWLIAQAPEWQADAFERLCLARSGQPLHLSWGQTLVAPACADSVCNALVWRESLLADWQIRLSREAPQVQTWLAPWTVDPRLQVVALRWPEPGAAAQTLPVNDLACPVDWRCVAMLGWP